MTPVRLEPTTPLSRVRHSTTEPLRSRAIIVNDNKIMLVMGITGSREYTVWQQCISLSPSYAIYMLKAFILV